MAKKKKSNNQPAGKEEGEKEAGGGSQGCILGIYILAIMIIMRGC